MSSSAHMNKSWHTQQVEKMFIEGGAVVQNSGPDPFKVLHLSPSISPRVHALSPATPDSIFLSFSNSRCLSFARALAHTHTQTCTFVCGVVLPPKKTWFHVHMMYTRTGRFATREKDSFFLALFFSLFATIFLLRARTSTYIRFPEKEKTRSHKYMTYTRTGLRCHDYARVPQEVDELHL